MTAHHVPLSTDYHGLPLRLIRARDKIIAPIRAIVAQSDLTEQQWRILTVLYDHGAMDATTLSKHCSLLLPSQTRILQSLVIKSLVEREIDPGDRRRHRLALTEQGRQVILQHAEKVAAVVADIEQKIGRKQLETLTQLLDELGAA
ncbi:MAG: MarR family transcriptional regulator [Pseudomonadota bacterium]